MIVPDAETLMAYADGELDDAGAAQVHAYLLTDERARAEVERLRRTATLAKAAFEPSLLAPVPDRLIDAVLNPPAMAWNVVSMRPARAVGGRRPAVQFWRMAMAACLALLVAGSAGVWLSQTDSSPDGEGLIALGPVRPGSALADILETKPSGALQASDANRTARLGVVATFRDKSDRVCREVEVLAGASEHRPVAAGVACRIPRAGTWIVEGAARVAAASEASGAGYLPSGASESDVLDGLLKILGARSSLSPDDEQRLLDSHWQ